MILQMTRAVQGGLRQEKQFGLVANHLANLNTNGFKADILAFDAKHKATQVVDHRQGPIRTTGNLLDMAVSGNGFFKIQTPEGVRYTRDGSFTLDRNMQLVTQNGNPVLGEGGPIVIQGAEAQTTDNVQIMDDGQVSVDDEIIGRVAVVDFADLTQLRKVGASLYVNDGDAADEMPAENFAVSQGALEGSNITPAIEMTKMIEVHRMYEAYQKMMQTFDEIDSKAITEVGKF